MSVSRPNMAKDVIKKKQRVAHNRANEGHEMYPECDDILTSIIQDMDNNGLIAPMCFSKFQTNLSETNKNTIHEKTQTSASQFPSRSNASLPKKFGISRKGPLMEKSQRTLKLLQHNRKQPKPRAHLAGLSHSHAGISFNSASSEKLKTKDANHVRSVNKFQNIEKHKRLAADIKRAHSIEESKSKEIPLKKQSPTVVKKSCPVKESSHVVKSVSKRHESATVKNKSSLAESSHIINSSDKIADNSSDSDEYEKFIRKEKKDLPTKPKSKKCDNVKSQKSSNVCRKRASKSVSTESESELSDEESSNSYKSKRRKSHNMVDNKKCTSSKRDEVPPKVRRKRNSRTFLKFMSSSSSSDSDSDGPSTSYEQKKVHKKSNRLSDASKEDSESQMDYDCDETYHDSSSEGDLPPPSEIIYGLRSAKSQFSEQVGSQQESEFSLHSGKACNIPSLVSADEPNILCNETPSHGLSNVASLMSSNEPNILQNKTSCEIPNASMVKSSQPNLSHMLPDVHSLVGSAQPNVSHKTFDLSSLGNVCTIEEGVALQNDSVSNNSQENSPKSLIIDLAESDNEAESSFTVTPKIAAISSQNQDDLDSYSEDSEVELVDVVVPPDLPVRSNKNVSHKQNGSNVLNIKTEKVCEITPSIPKSQGTKSNLESQTSLISKKYEVAYATGICQKSDEKNESKDKNNKQLNLNNDQPPRERRTSSDKIMNNELKSSTVINAKDSFVFNKKVKREPTDGDECEIVLDTTSTSNSSTNLPDVQVQSSKANIKVERDSEGIKQGTAIRRVNGDTIDKRKSSVVERESNLLVLNKKVKKEPTDGDECEIILDTTSTSKSSTNLSNSQIHSNSNIKVERDCKAVEQAPSPHNKIAQPPEKEAINELNPIKALLESLKKEFNTYQEIIVTEQSVETTFRVLERCQADRLKSLKKKIIECLESAPSISDSDSIKLQMNKMLEDSPGLSSSTSSACPSECSSDISLQDLKTLANMNIVPLSSISEKDIKPNLSELQRAVKQEPSSSYEINSMSFGEKCIVCAKDAAAACQQCAKVFFCSNECGRKYWEDGHKNSCIK